MHRESERRSPKRPTVASVYHPRAESEFGAPSGCGLATKEGGTGCELNGGSDFPEAESEFGAPPGCGLATKERRRRDYTEGEPKFSTRAQT
jgi:hypothetical protein